MTQKATQEKLETGNWRIFKLLLRFLACLQGLFEGEGIFSVLDELFSRAVDLQAASSEDVSLSEIILARDGKLIAGTDCWTRACQDYSSHRSLRHLHWGSRCSGERNRGP